MKKAKILFLTLILLSVPLFVFAYNASEENIYIAADEVIDGNFVKVANIINIAGAVNGDVILVGSNISISGPVAGDVFALASNIVINGDVQGSVRAMAGNIEISSKVDRNVNAFASTITISESSEIGWDLIAAGGSIENKGRVLGNVNVAGGNIILDNEVGKDVILNLGVDGRGTLHPGTKILGNLIYKSTKADQLEINEGAQISGETRHEVVTAGGIQAPSFSAFYFLGKLVSLFGLMIVGLVIITLTPKFVSQVSIEMTKAPWHSLGWGLIYTLLTPIVIILLFFTIIGIPLATILIPVYFIALYLAKVFAGITVGLIIVNWVTKGKYKKTLIWPMVLGLVVLDVIYSIPFLGWFVCLLAILWALGALIEVKKAILADLR